MTNTEYILNQDKADPKLMPKLNQLKEILKIDRSIQWIESYDISHHSGSNAVAGCVVYSENGKEKNSIAPII